LGAPYVDVNGDGEYTPGVDYPDYIGDEILFYVANDLDTARSLFTFETYPIGLEFQTTTYAFDETNFLADAVFKKYVIINKGNDIVENMYFSYWADNDLGNAGDDFAGCDTNLFLGYNFNADNDDEGGYGYGTPPPAVGHKIVQGPIVPGNPTDSAMFNGEWRMGFINLPMTAFSLYRCGGGGVQFSCPGSGIDGGIQIYNNMQGLDPNGDPYIDPNTGLETKFCVPGDPYNGTGWYEGAGWPGGSNPGDRYYLLTSGPFVMAPGDTQEVVYSIFMAIGSDNFHSVSKLKEKAIEIQNYYGVNIITDPKKSLPNIPEEFVLYQNYPNPFNSTTIIKYSISVKINVELKVFDILGREIKTLVNEVKEAGRYEVIFSGSKLSSGIYFYRLKAGDFLQTKKLLYLK